MKKKWKERLGWIVLFLLIWEGSVKLFGVSEMLFPPVEEVAAVLAEGILKGELLRQTLYSVWVIAVSLAVSAALALFLALLSQRYAAAASLIDTVTALAHPLPGLALLPLIIMWFGTGRELWRPLLYILPSGRCLSTCRADFSPCLPCMRKSEKICPCLRGRLRWKSG